MKFLNQMIAPLGTGLKAKMSTLDSLRADAIFGYRQLLKTKTTSAAAILSLALAIGAFTSAFGRC